jgi:hypothetical protein
LGKKEDNQEERFAFSVYGDLAKCVNELKRRGYFMDNAEIGRTSLPFLIDHYRKLGMIE